VLAVGRLNRRAGPDQQGRQPGRALYEAASAVLTRYKGKTALKCLGQKIAKRCQKKAVVTVARKLAVIMYAMWRGGTIYADRPHTNAAPTAKERKLLGTRA
jgi:transposase